MIIGLIAIVKVGGAFSFRNHTGTPKGKMPGQHQILLLWGDNIDYAT